jgi:hypothetical protein
MQAGKKGGEDRQGQDDACLHRIFCKFNGLIARYPNLMVLKTYEVWGLKLVA